MRVFRMRDCSTRLGIWAFMIFSQWKGSAGPCVWLFRMMLSCGDVYILILFLGEKITDDVLLRLTQRAQGNLQCLSLSGCSRITDDGVKCVLDNNPKLKKLSVAGCVRLSLDGIINNLKAFRSQGTPGIEHLKLGRLFSISGEQFGALKLLLGIDQHQQAQAQKPRFYHTSDSSLVCDDDCVIDVEMCPVCQKYKLVYDCPSEGCQEKGPKHCRACDFCIARCIQCGKCIKDCMYVETFCLEYLCSGCWKEALHENIEAMKRSEFALI
ncbi:unnamed protein product [Musa banksii]